MDYFSNTIDERIIEMALPHRVFDAMRKGGSGEYGFGHIVRVSEYATTFDEYVVALMHDCVEDGFATYDNLATMGLTSHQIAAVQLLTRVEGQTYKDYIKTLTEAYNTPEGKLALRVKQYDIYDHLHPDRIQDRSISGLRRYLDALEEILTVQVIRK